MVSQTVHNPMMIIGLTGGIGCGKSTAAAMFSELGVPVLSADKISAELLEHDAHIFSMVVEKFGSEILKEPGVIDRTKLRKRIFTNDTEKSWLEALLHPAIRQQLIERTQKITAPYCIVEIPLLLETDMLDMVDRVLTIDCPVAAQLERSTKRDQSSEADIMAIINAQINRDLRIMRSDDLIDNSKDLAWLRQQIVNKHAWYLQMNKPIVC